MLLPDTTWADSAPSLFLFSDSDLCVGTETPCGRFVAKGSRYGYLQKITRPWSQHRRQHACHCSNPHCAGGLAERHSIVNPTLALQTISKS